MVLRGAGEEEMRGEYALCGFDQTFLKFDAKRFDQTFSKFDAWFESMRGDGERKENPKRAPRRGAMI